MSTKPKKSKPRLKKYKVEYNCNTCDRNFSSNNAWQLHVVNKICSKQGSKKSSKLKLKYTTPLHNGVYHFRCLQNSSEDCEKLIRYSRKNLQHHYEKYHTQPEDLIYACKHCEMKFPIELLLNYHNRKMHESYMCLHCNRKFEWECKLQAHAITCRLKNKPQLKYTVVMQNGKYHFSCRSNKSEDCKKLIRYSPSNLNYHYQTYHSQPEELIYVCEYCGMKFPIEVMLNWHNRKTHNSKYICSYCGLGFALKHAHQRHQRTHEKVSEGEKYPCEYCDKRFACKEGRKQHQERKHDLDGKYHTKLCPICGKSFMYTSNLQVHMDSHTHAKSHPNYTCDLCNKGFKSEGGIRLHRRKIHNIGHVCEISEHGKICNKKFSSHRSLSIHQREVHCLIVNLHEPHAFPKRCELSKNSGAEDILPGGCNSIVKDAVKNDAPKNLIKIANSKGVDENCTEEELSEEAKVYCPVIACCLKFDSTQLLNQHLVIEHDL